MKRLTPDFTVEAAPLNLEPGKIHHFIWGPTTIAYSIWDGDDSLLIQSIRTKTSECKKGHARTAMEKFLSLVDEVGIEIDLGASPLNKATKLDKLVSFYQSLGFELTGKSINAAGEPQMVRSAASKCMGNLINKNSMFPG